ncbi:unnamed protein product [Zymoseptoria tritici ST99CH_3D7]|uniref:Uncharacterized protein n=1 Tax=Zymoseptoria tritici (strain ST99CH_3D7) TaxID=1276538 RepID=A0A1X7S2P7_ZYMT9|nr:unnamed protein product [Zymoseptoria tritici ST99CH_3D7]
MADIKTAATETSIGFRKKYSSECRAEYRQTLQLFDEGQFEEAIDAARTRVMDAWLPHFWQLKYCIIIIRSLDSWDRAEKYLEIADEVWQATFRDSNNSAQSSLGQLRKDLDNIRAEQDEQRPDELEGEEKVTGEVEYKEEKTNAPWLNEYHRDIWRSRNKDTVVEMVHTLDNLAIGVMRRTCKAESEGSEHDDDEEDGTTGKVTAPDASQAAEDIRAGHAQSMPEDQNRVQELHDERESLPRYWQLAYCMEIVKTARDEATYEKYRGLMLDLWQAILRFSEKWGGPEAYEEKLWPELWSEISFWRKETFDKHRPPRTNREALMHVTSPRLEHALDDLVTQFLRGTCGSKSINEAIAEINDGEPEEAHARDSSVDGIWLDTEQRTLFDDNEIIGAAPVHKPGPSAALDLKFAAKDTTGERYLKFGQLLRDLQQQHKQFKEALPRSGGDQEKKHAESKVQQADREAEVEHVREQCVIRRVRCAYRIPTSKSEHVEDDDSVVEYTPESSVVGTPAHSENGSSPSFDSDASDHDKRRTEEAQWAQAHEKRKNEEAQWTKVREAKKTEYDNSGPATGFMRCMKDETRMQNSSGTNSGEKEEKKLRISDPDIDAEPAKPEQTLEDGSSQRDEIERLKVALAVATAKAKTANGKSKASWTRSKDLLLRQREAREGFLCQLERELENNRMQTARIETRIKEHKLAGAIADREAAAQLKEIEDDLAAL